MASARVGHAPDLPTAAGSPPTIRAWLRNLDSDIPVPPGLVLRPFRALRYARDAAALAAVTSPPYDVIDDRERAELLARDPHNVVRLILPQDGDDGTSRYERGRPAAHAMAQRRHAASATPQPALYVYEETADGSRPAWAGGSGGPRPGRRRDRAPARGHDGRAGQ